MRGAAALSAGAILASLVWTAVAQAAEDRDAIVRRDRERLGKSTVWIYDDIARGFAESAKSGKPLAVAFRCPPCTAFERIDRVTADAEGPLGPLLARFVCVRVPHANAMDLTRFEIDWDLSWAVVFLDADGTVLGRYASRSSQDDAERDVSAEGFAKTLEGVLALHGALGDPSGGVRRRLTGKAARPPLANVPEALPPLKGRFGSSLDWDGPVAKSCVHCHQVGEALRTMARESKAGLGDMVLFPHPDPRVLGIDLDPTERTTVRAVSPGSAATTAGVMPGDEIVRFGGDDVVSAADMRWVLHNAPASGVLAVSVRRGGKDAELSLPLAERWRDGCDISWRTTTWDLRRMVLGGLRLETAKDSSGSDVLRVKHVGQYGAHAAAKKAGVRKGDVVIAVDAPGVGVHGVGVHGVGPAELRDESRLIAALLRGRRPGEQVTLTLRRGEGAAAETLTATFPSQ